MNDPQMINSDYVIDDIEIPFKVLAGPGAGKTYWLARHIENVLKNSPRFTPVSLVACITYTNTGTEELQTELKDASDRIWISTIHSFLYANIVKPYIWLLEDDVGTSVVNFQEMNGHDDNVPSPGKLYQWKKDTNLYHIDDIHARNCLAKAVWSIKDGNLQLIVKPDYLRRVGKYWIKQEELYPYKKLCWHDGIIHHDDVLYFSYVLLTQFPFLLDCLAAKFPYIFLDEFQDTNPIQTEIVKMLSTAGSCVGVIGDPAQSIFGFADASRTDFLDFDLPNMNLYHMDTNRRSTNQIVKTLNIIRNGDDLVQRTFRKIEGRQPEAYVTADILTAVILFEEKATSIGGDYCIVSRNNAMVYKIKRRDMDTSQIDLWDNLHNKLGDRAVFLERLLIAREYANQNRFELASKELNKIFRPRTNGSLREPFSAGASTIDPLSIRGMCIYILQNLVSQKDQYRENDLLVFYNWIGEMIYSSCARKLSKVTSRGDAKMVMEEVTVGIAANEIKLPEVKIDTIRTIHKSKGAQFDSVLVIFEDEKELDHLIEPDIDAEDDGSRIYYVGLSRAKNFMSVAIPPVEADALKIIQAKGFRIIECGS